MKGVVEMGYIHCERSERNKNPIDLHDCKAGRAYYKDSVLGFEFVDGFWITPDHPESNLDVFVKTDASKVEFELFDGEERDVTIYVYEKNFFNQTVRNEWSIDKLVQGINSGKYVLTFLYKYVDGYSSIVECVLESQQKPYISIECTMKLYEIDVYYYWNKILEDRVW